MQIVEPRGLRKTKVVMPKATDDSFISKVKSGERLLLQHPATTISLVASLLLVAMPFVPSSFLLLVVGPGAPSSVLVPTSNHNISSSFFVAVSEKSPWALWIQACKRVAKMSCRSCAHTLMDMHTELKAVPQHRTLLHFSANIKSSRCTELIRLCFPDER